MGSFQQISHWNCKQYCVRAKNIQETKSAVEETLQSLEHGVISIIFSTQSLQRENLSTLECFILLLFECYNVNNLFFRLCHYRYFVHPGCLRAAFNLTLQKALKHKLQLKKQKIKTNLLI